MQKNSKSDIFEAMKSAEYSNATEIAEMLKKAFTYEKPKSIKKILTNISREHQQIISNTMQHSRPNVRWSNIAGLEKPIEILKDAAKILTNPQIFKKTKLLKPTKGVLLFGPPGTGKTFLAKALATESNSRFFYVKPSDLLSQYVTKFLKNFHLTFVGGRS